MVLISNAHPAGRRLWAPGAGALSDGCKVALLGSETPDPKLSNHRRRSRALTKSKPSAFKGLEMKITEGFRLVDHLLDPDSARAISDHPIYGVTFLIAQDRSADIGED